MVDKATHQITTSSGGTFETASASQKTTLHRVPSFGDSANESFFREQIAHSNGAASNHNDSMTSNMTSNMTMV